ncbi:uncharacterized protein LOC112082016 [Eutrema salsugineum]|uniref:uncharacterized protein LOC112082016 n=1 Tax=Eutrema salsugineum TaxID=72664 RepID=UPI000CED04F9|nr:uncharacterized protein LOC112082016 [Eutrema salsugineum]
MMNTKSVAVLMMVMMVAMGMQNILVQANRPLCEFSGTCGGRLEPSPSPLQDDSFFDSGHTPNPSQDDSIFDSGHTPNPSQDDSFFNSGHTPNPSQDLNSFDFDLSSKPPAPSSDDFGFDLAPNSISPSPMSVGSKMYFCMYGCSIHHCINLGKDPKDIEQFDNCVAKCSETCTKKKESEDTYV